MDWNRNGVKRLSITSAAQSPPHGEEEDHDRLQDERQHAGHRSLALHGEAPGLQRGEEEGGDNRPNGLTADKERRHQPGPGVGWRDERPVDESELRAEHDDRPDEAGDGAAREHRSYGLPSEPHAAVSGETRVLAPHPQFVTCARPPVDEDDGERDRRDEETAGIERSGQDVKARVRRDHEGLRQSG